MGLIIVGHECSQAVTIRLRQNGHQAYSCDLKPASGGRPDWHLQMDVFEAIKLKPWDAGIFFPDCTYLVISAEWAYKDPDFIRYPGVGYHQRLKPETLRGKERRVAREKGIDHVKKLWNCGINVLSIENPVGKLSTAWKQPSQIIQPYQFGEDASKRTCLWLKNLPKLTGTNYVEPRMVKGKPRWSNQTDTGQNKLSPSSERGAIRAIRYPGIAEAISNQWFPRNELAWRHRSKQLTLNFG